MRFLGVDLAWSEGASGRTVNESGVVALLPGGDVLNAGWTRGVEETVAWATSVAGEDPAMLFVDAPLVVDNVRGQRLCEKQVGQRYGRWKVSANTTNLGSPRLAGTALRERLETAGWQYVDGLTGTAGNPRTLSECYPYTTLVGTVELGYEHERPRYKRKPRAMPVRRWRSERATACDELIARLGRLTDVNPPLHLDSHPATRELTLKPSPIDDAAYKHREDLIDAILCAWTAAMWHEHGLLRCQVLGPPAASMGGPIPTIIAPARPEQRR